MPNDAKAPNEIETEKVQLIEEEATVGIRATTTGRVRITTQVETFEQIAAAALSSDTVEVTRVPMDRFVDGDVPQMRTEGELTIIPIFEEVLVVEKRLMLKEELHVRKRTALESVSLPMTLRRQTADIDRVEV